ncbi:MAG: ATP-binding protein [Pseudomonadales bacterium]|nr:ATP-binding protein [Pseudomonadales bacterium]
MPTKFWKPNKLSLNLAVSLTICAFIYVAILLVVFVLVDIPKFEQQIEDNLNQIIDSFTQPASQAVVHQSSDTANAVLTGFRQFGFVSKATIVTGQGKILAEIDVAANEEPVGWIHRWFLPSEKHNIYYRLLHDERNTEAEPGSLIVLINKYKALQPAFSRLKSVLWANLLQFFVFACIVYFVVYRLVTRRLLAINDALLQISPKKPNGGRVPEFSNRDEVSTLAKGINRFIHTAETYLEDKHQAEKGLLYLTQHLEEVIRERTVDFERARLTAENANRAKSVFLSNMSHELRTPLNAILGFTTRILKKADSSTLGQRERDALLRVFDNGQYLLNLVNDLLDIAKIEADKMELNISQFDINDVIQETCSRLISLAEEKHLRINNLCLNPISVTGDRDRIQQVVTNLLSNAIKYTLQGAVTVSAQRIREAETESVAITVADTGIGIREQDLIKIFDPYNHVHSDLNQVVSVQSTGLGLPLSKKIVELHQGCIEVESSYGEGSLFTVIFPLNGFTDKNASKLSNERDGANSLTAQAK